MLYSRLPVLQGWGVGCLTVAGMKQAGVLDICLGASQRRHPGGGFRELDTEIQEGPSQSGERCAKALGLVCLQNSDKWQCMDTVARDLRGT